MAHATLDEIIQLADELSIEDRAALLNHLERRAALTEHQRQRESGAFATSPSLMGRFANPALDLTAEEISAIRHEASTAWESEIDEILS